MTKTILITGATDGIGLATAKLLRTGGHDLLIHGRNQGKLDAVEQELLAMPGGGRVATYCADLSSLSATAELAREIVGRENSLDVLINNAGVFSAPENVSGDGLDVRFAVNTIAPYLLASSLSLLLGKTGRIINLSSAAQATVLPGAIEGQVALSDDAAYAQSKLALTMWTHAMAEEFGSDGPAVLAVNPGSLLGSKMVKDAYGLDGKDLSIGATILARAATDDAFDHSASGRYFDNDRGTFSDPHPDAMSPAKNAAIVERIESVLAQIGV